MSAYDTATETSTEPKLTDFDRRPDGCECWSPESRLPCWTCYLEGFDTPNPNATGESD